MTPEAQIIAIAEACGWIKTYEEGEDEGCGKWFWHKGNQNLKRPPDYCNDLNAMHEAEKVLESNQEQSYFELLHDIAGNLKFYRATAAQRAEAFLKTLNLWKP